MFKKILVPVDFSAQCRKSYEIAVGFAREFGAEIVLLHVGVIPSTPEHLDPTMSEVERMYEGILKSRLDSARKVLNDWREEYSRQGVVISDVIAEGVPHEKIIEVGQDISADLIVMGTHGRRGFSRFFVGSTAERVVRLSIIPVLTVRVPEDEDESK